MTVYRLQIRTERHGQAPAHDRRPASARPPAFRPGAADLRKADNAWFGAAHAGPDEIAAAAGVRVQVAAHEPELEHAPEQLADGPVDRHAWGLGQLADPSNSVWEQLHHPGDQVVADSAACSCRCSWPTATATR